MRVVCVTQKKALLGLDNEKRRAENGGPQTPVPSDTRLAADGLAQLMASSVKSKPAKVCL